MDLDDFRSILHTAGVDVWMFIDTAISVAAQDNAGELKRRRDGIVERLYAASTEGIPMCQNCDGGQRLVTNDNQIKKENSPSLSPERQPRRGGASSPPTPQSEGNEDGEDEEIDPYGGLFDDEQKKILEIKELLEDPHQSEDTLMELLQNLVDIDITFQELKETDIGRNVNQLRKHPSSDVRRLVKLLVKKWKEIVDDWVKQNPQRGKSTLMADGDSPLQKTTPNGHNHQIPDFAYSPNPHNGSSGSDRNTSEAEPKPKPKSVPRKDPPPKPRPSPPVTAPTSAPQNRQREQKESNFDAERLAAARKRLQANYKEADNAKKQRTIQVMDIHELPKSKAKSGYFAKHKGGGSSQGRQHW
ncbi:putative transcription regulator IWS1 family [Medicago truncatula]|uniref:Putative transcription regulator IWS1 family n=2 Tax=Trifolieae TaxID=163742 RepID=G7JAV9_MEDTR|nr:probable mediator of RNA polymerase II transcription subunit 26c [Medicago truncatula]AES72781.1 transcription elongation factor (TFIIS) family protein [Medicago truncatula]RHN69876.1 putative transcription regulator IWS1 family [Medicago truncatula]